MKFNKTIKKGCVWMGRDIEQIMFSLDLPFEDDEVEEWINVKLVDIWIEMIMIFVLIVKYKCFLVVVVGKCLVYVRWKNDF